MLLTIVARRQGAAGIRRRILYNGRALARGLRSDPADPPIRRSMSRTGSQEHALTCPLRGRADYAKPKFGRAIGLIQ
jgi:hypothetical protein